MEAQISLIAAGKAEKLPVVLHTLAQFAHKFRFFVAHIARMDALFEASFSPLASSGGITTSNVISDQTNTCLLEGMCATYNLQ